MKILLSILLCLISNIFSQVDFSPTLDLHLGALGGDRLVLVEIPMINSAVVFQRLPTTAMCPTTRAGDFELKKVNPLPWRSATSESIRGFCTSVDSISINTEQIYEINTSSGETYYMQLIELVQEKVKVRITSGKPVVQILQKKSASPIQVSDKKFMADGKMIQLGLEKAPTVQKWKVFFGGGKK